MPQTIDTQQLTHELNYINFNYYETGWINTDDWTNRHLGSTALPKNTDSYVAHNLNADATELIVKICINTQAIDTGCWEVYCPFQLGPVVSWSYRGFTIYQINKNNLKVQTGTDGVIYLDDNGKVDGLAANDIYYNIKVFRLSKS